jgi:hypothetical protein
MVSAADPTAVNLSFLDRSRYFFFQIAPHLSSQGLLMKVCILQEIFALTGNVLRSSYPND